MYLFKKTHLSFATMLSALLPLQFALRDAPSSALTKIQFTGCQLNPVILCTAVFVEGAS